MGGSQMLLVLGAIVLLSFVTLNVHRSILNSTEATLQSEFFLTANTIASELMNEITSKSFDENTISTDLAETDIPVLFTAAGSLGPDGEVYPAFDDVDDFKGYSRTIPTPRLDTLTAIVSVDYVNISNPDIILAYRSRTKRIAVSVSHPAMADTLRLYHYASY